MNYTTSKDYEKLWELVQEGKKVPCLYYDRGIQRAGIAQKCCGTPAPPAGNFCLNKEIFIQCCEADQVEMLLPNAWIKIESDKDFRKIPDQDVNFIKDGKAHAGAIFEGMLTDMYDAVIGATHWMPMPEVPKE